MHCTDRFDKADKEVSAWDYDIDVGTMVDAMMQCELAQPTYPEGDDQSAIRVISGD